MTRQIPLSGKKGDGLFALIDDTDFEELSQYKWYIMPTGYIVRKTQTRKGVNVYMHRQILNPPQDAVIDHKNGNRADNRRCNLRITTQAKNLQNAAPRKNKTSRYKGVMWSEGQWRAKIQIDGTQIELGYFATQHEAALAYNRAAKELFGEFARPNEIIDDPADKPVRLPETQPSRFHGVCWDKRREKWMAKIMANGTHINLGRYANEIEAAAVYDTAARILHGDKAKLNFPSTTSFAAKRGISRPHDETYLYRCTATGSRADNATPENPSH